MRLRKTRQTTEALRNLESCYTKMNAIRSGVKPPQAESRGEFTIKSSEPFRLPASTFATACSDCYKSLQGSYIFSCTLRGEELLHESCWSERSKMTVKDYFAKQYDEGRQGQVELKRIIETKEAEVFVDTFDAGQIFCDLVNNMSVRKKKQVRKPPSTPSPRAQGPKSEDKRAKELAALSKELASKEAVTLAPVTTTPPLASERVEQQKSSVMICDLYSQLISTDYLLVKRLTGSDLRCHELCWEKNKHQEGVKKIYRYNSEGKCLEKLSFAFLPVESAPSPVVPPVEVSPIAEYALTIPEVVPPVPKEYRPSWREVDVNDYESLKKKEVPKDEQRRQRRQAKKAAKAAKFIDLGAYQAQREKELIREGNKVWNQIFQVPPKEPRVERPAEAPEFIPPVRVLLCTDCGVYPCAVVNYPCWHVTFCHNCSYLHSLCPTYGMRLPANY